jgi:hypothetical protein
MNDYVIRQQTRRAIAFSQVGLGKIAADAVWNAHQIATERRAGMRHEFDWPDYCLVPINAWRGWLESSAPEKDCARLLRDGPSCGRRDGLGAAQGGSRPA